ncbi:MAG: hypothetical protein AAFN30_17630, partial [Actinomycetota bacterium]
MPLGTRRRGTIVINVAARAIFVDVRPLSLTVGAITALAYNELLRLHHARRREAVIDEEVYAGSAIGLGVVALLSVVGVTLADRLDDAGDRNWLWMAATVVLLMVAATLITMVPRRRV